MALIAVSAWPIRRLSIIDLSNKGAQPMANADGTYVITFNGEIYNYRDCAMNLRRLAVDFIHSAIRKASGDCSRNTEKRC